MSKTNVNVESTSKNGMLIFAYLIPIISGGIVFALYNDNPKLKFHGTQALVYWLFSLIVIGLVGSFVSPTVVYSGLFSAQIIQNPFGWVPNLLFLLAWIYSLYIGYNAFNGNDEKARIPLMADVATSAAPNK